MSAARKWAKKAKRWALKAKQAVSSSGSKVHERWLCGRACGCWGGCCERCWVHTRQDTERWGLCVIYAV
jgi:hypothetical protein